MPDRRMILISASSALLAGAALVVRLPAASAQPMGGEPQDLPVDSDPLRIHTAGGERVFAIEVADEDHERSRGLMHRRFMQDNRGMLFIFPRTRRLSFWMKNTPMALDLVFIGEDGRIVAIEQGVPFSEAPISPPQPARFVLELKSGIARRNGVAVGDAVSHPLIDQVAGPQ